MTLPAVDTTTRSPGVNRWRLFVITLVPFSQYLKSIGHRHFPPAFVVGSVLRCPQFIAGVLGDPASRAMLLMSVSVHARIFLGYASSRESCENNLTCLLVDTFAWVLFFFCLLKKRSSDTCGVCVLPVGLS